MDSWLPIAISTRADGVRLRSLLPKPWLRDLPKAADFSFPKCSPSLAWKASSHWRKSPMPSAQPSSIAHLASTCLTLRSTSSWMRLTATVSTMKRYAPLHRSMKTPMFSNCGMVPPALLRIWRCNAYPISLAQVHLSCANRESWKTPFLSWLPPRATPARLLSKDSATKMASRLR